VRLDQDLEQDLDTTAQMTPDGLEGPGALFSLFTTRPFLSSSEQLQTGIDGQSLLAVIVCSGWNVRSLALPVLALLSSVEDANAATWSLKK
jgi:hypothetical protein